MTPEEAKSWLQTTGDYEFAEETVIDALKTIAGLHYEYAVQVTDEDGDWVGIDAKGLPTYDYGKITWHKSRRAAMESLNDLPFPAMQSRIVRRLVTDEEVVG